MYSALVLQSELKENDVSEIKPRPVIPEENIRSAVYNFFSYGLTPGSYTTYMLLHDFDRAKQSAHPLLINEQHAGYTVHDLMIMAFENLPEFMIKENFRKWPGYVNLTDSEGEQIRKPYYNKEQQEYETYCMLNNITPSSFKDWFEMAEWDLSQEQAHHEYFSRS